MERPRARARPVRHHRRRSRLLRRTGSSCWRELGYGRSTADERRPGLGRPWSIAHPEGRKAVFVGDLVDRGPRVLDTRAASSATWSRPARRLCVPGNHDMKLLKKLSGQGRADHARPGRVAGRDRRPARTTCGAPFTKSLAEFLDGLVSHYVLDDGKLVVAHAGMKAEMQGRGSGKVRDFALYGETTGETDEFGLPVRYNWAAEYRGAAMVVYGHTPVPEPEWLNRTVNIDTGCVFGGKLTALRYPEREFVSVPAARTYCEPARPFLPDEQQAPKLTGPAGPRRRARRRGRAGQADRLDPAAGQRHDPGGERHGGAGGDEPVRRQPEVADLPAAHDVAVRDDAPSRACWNTRPRRSPTTAARACRRSSAKRSTWGRGPSSSSAGTRQAARERFGVTDGRDRASSSPAPAGGSSTTPALEAQFLDRRAGGADGGRTSGTSSTRRGCASTAN